MSRRRRGSRSPDRRSSDLSLCPHAPGEEGEVLLVRVELRQEVEQSRTTARRSRRSPRRRRQWRAGSLAVGYGDAQTRRARPPDADLHARRGQGRDEPWRRFPRLEARSRASPRWATSTSSTRSLGWPAASTGSRTSSSTSAPISPSPTPATRTACASPTTPIDRLEQEIDEANASLPELKSFVLPGGSERAARLFLARAVCRRAERAVLAVPDTNPLAAIYLNRLSDLLFVLARVANAEAGVDGPLWRPGGCGSGA